jgi:hypothetical protein
MAIGGGSATPKWPKGLAMSTPNFFFLFNFLLFFLFCFCFSKIWGQLGIFNNFCKRKHKLLIDESRCEFLILYWSTLLIFKH